MGEYKRRRKSIGKKSVKTFPLYLRTPPFMCLLPQSPPLCGTWQCLLLLFPDFWLALICLLLLFLKKEIEVNL